MASSMRARFTARELTLVGIFAAITGILAQFSIPLTPVPFSFGLFGVFFSAIILNTRLAVSAQIIYLLLSAVGVPVFSQFSAGIQRLVGPTGGYLVAYVLMAFIMGQFVCPGQAYAQLLVRAGYLYGRAYSAVCVRQRLAGLQHGAWPARDADGRSTALRTIRQHQDLDCCGHRPSRAPIAAQGKPAGSTVENQTKKAAYVESYPDIGRFCLQNIRLQLIHVLNTLSGGQIGDRVFEKRHIGQGRHL